VRVALVVPGGVDASLSEKVIPALLWLVEALGKRHEVVVFALGHGEEPARWEIPGASVVDLGRMPRGRLPGLATFERVRELGRLLAAEGPFDVVHAFWATPCGFAAAAALATAAALAAPRLPPVPLVVSLAGGELVGLPEIGYGVDLVPRERAKAAWALSRAAAVTAASAGLVRVAARRGFSARRIPLGVERDAFLPPRSRAASPPFRLLHAADLNRVKDQPTLLGAMARLAARGVPFRLDVAGEDVLGGRVQALAARLGLGGHVAFHGRLATPALRALLGEADLFVLSSRHEAGPVAVLEAAACALPTVGTSVGHVAEGNGSWSVATPVGDDAPLAAAIEETLLDPARLERMGRAALAWARENDVDSTADRFSALYDEVTAARK